MSKFWLVIGLVLVLTGPSFAGDLAARGRSLIYSCGGFHRRVEEVEITYRSAQMPEGTKLRLHWGLGGKMYRDGTFKVVTWDNGQSRAQDARTADADPYFDAQGAGVYVIRLNLSVQELSEAAMYSSLQFVIKREEPGRIVWEKPGQDSSQGYYEVNFAYYGTCVGNGSYPSPHDLPIHAVLAP